MYRFTLQQFVEPFFHSYFWKLRCIYFFRQMWSVKMCKYFTKVPDFDDFFFRSFVYSGVCQKSTSFGKVRHPPLPSRRWKRIFGFVFPKNRKFLVHSWSALGILQLRASTLYTAWCRKGVGFKFKKVIKLLYITGEWRSQMWICFRNTTLEILIIEKY